MLVSQATCARRHIRVGLNGLRGSELGGNFAAGCSGHRPQRIPEVSGFVKITRVYSTQLRSCKCWREGAGDPGRSVAAAAG